MKENIKNRAIIYCRVSTIEQANEGMSLHTQERLCRDYADKQGIDVDQVFIERGESAKTIDRTELQKMMKYCKLNEGKLNYLLIYKIDRLSRDTGDYSSLRAFFASCGVKIQSISEPIDDNPIGRFIENTFANVAQLDNEIRTERTVNGMIDAMKEGRYTFPNPYGFNREGKKGESNIVPDVTLAPVIRRVFDEIYHGVTSLEELRRTARHWGLELNNKPLITSHFNKMLRNPVYKGYIEIPSMGINQKGAFNAIVDPSVFDAVQDILNGRKKKGRVYSKVHPDFPLRGTIKCTCGKLMTSNWSKGKGGRYGYYRCTECKRVNLRKSELEPEFIDFLKNIQLVDKVQEAIVFAVSLNWQERISETIKIRSELETRRKKVLILQDSIVEKNIQGVLSDSLAKRRLSDTEKEIMEIDSELIRYQSPEESENEVIEYALSFMSDMSNSWQNLQPSMKNKFQKSLFPEGLIYENENFTTPVKPLSVELNEMFVPQNSTLVAPGGIEPPLPG